MTIDRLRAVFIWALYKKTLIRASDKPARFSDHLDILPCLSAEMKTANSIGRQQIIVRIMLGLRPFIGEGFTQKPYTLFRFVNQLFQQACGCNVIVLVTNIVCQPQVVGMVFIICQQLPNHI